MLDVLVWLFFYKGFPLGLIHLYLKFVGLFKFTLLLCQTFLQHACSDKPNHVKFEPEVTALQKFNDADYQPTYFVANSIFDAIKKLRCDQK